MSVPNTPNTDYQPLSFDQAIQFYWDPPTGPSVTEYRLTLNYNGGSLVFTPAAADITYLVTGLTNGVTYSATLEARNENGYSTPGTYRDWQAGAPPNTPDTATAMLVGSNGATISWTAGTPVNAQVQWYVIDMYSTSNPLPLASYSANGLTQSNFFIGGLSTNLVYYFNVSAVNCPDYSTPRTTSTIQFQFPFTPTQLSGLNMWLDAQDSATVLKTGNNVYQWSDKSGTNNHAYNPTSVNQPIVSSIGAYPALGFYGNGSLSTNTLTFNNSNYSLFFVNRHVIVNNGWRLLMRGYTSGGGSVTIHPAAADNGTYAFFVSGNGNDWNDLTSNSPPYYLSTPNIAAGVVANNILSPYYSGNAQNTKNGQTIAFNRLIIGNGAQNGTQPFNGQIGEILQYNVSLTPFDRQKVEGYLAWKWGLQSNLPTSHPFRADAPYSNSVFSPTNFSSLQLWLDAQDPTANGSVPSNGTSFTTWIDKSGKNNNAAIYAGNALTYSNTTINSYPTLYMSNNANSSQLRASVPSNTFVSSFMAFAVFKVATEVGNTTLMNRGTNNKPGPWDMSGTERLTGDSSSYNLPSNASFNVQTATSNSLFVYGSTPSQWNEYVFGNLSNTFNWPNTYWGDPASYVYIGERADGNHNFIGYMGEFILYNRILDTGDRQTVEGYLAWKWGLQSNLPGTHPYYDNNPGALAPTIFTPSNFTGLNIWLDASDATTFTYSGLNITAWADKSGSSNNVGYTSGGNYATRTTDAGKTIVQFPSAASQYNSALTTAYTTNQFTVFYVMKKTNTKYTQWLAAGGVNTIYDYGPFLGCLYNGPSPGAGDGSSFFTVNGSRNTVNSATYTTYHIVRGTGNGGTTNVRVGVNHPSDYFYGSICEILIYNRKALLSDTQAQQVEGYLAWKWGLQNTLPYTHPYKFINPAATTTNAIVSSGLLIEFDADIYGGGGFWPNTGSLGQTYNATPSGTVSKNAAGNGVVFGGATSYSFPNIGVQTNFTLSVWFKRTAAMTGVVGIVSDSWNGTSINMAITTNYGSSTDPNFKGTIWQSGSVYQSDQVTFTNGLWIQMVVTWDNTTNLFTTYSNATQIGSITYSGLTPGSSGSTYKIGTNWDGNGYLKGELGQVLIYNRALTAAEVTQNYTATSNTFSV